MVNAPVAILASPTVAVISPKVRDSGIQKSGLWNPKYSKKKNTHTHTQKHTQKNSGIPLKIGIQNPISTEKDWNPVPEIRNPWGEIQTSRLSWFPLHGTRHCCLIITK